MTILGAVFHRFPDTASEQRYRRELRGAQAPFNRALMVIGAAMLGA